MEFGNALALYVDGLAGNAGCFANLTENKVEEDKQMRSFSSWPIHSARASSFLVLTLVLSFSGRVFAQKSVAADATIPFAFDVRGEAFAAGDYVVNSSAPSFIFIRSKDGRHFKDVPTINYGDPVEKRDARLVFVKRNGKYVLHAVYSVLGKRIVTPELAEQSSSDKDTNEVPLTFETGSSAGSLQIPQSP